jgi:hypothetical protein
MNQRDIIKLARQAGFNPTSYMGSNIELFEHFAELVKQQVLDEVSEIMGNVTKTYRGTKWGKAAECIEEDVCAAIIARHFGF